MRLGEISDGLIDAVAAEFKKRRSLSINVDATNMVVDILNEWLDASQKKVNPK